MGWCPSLPGRMSERYVIETWRVGRSGGRATGRSWLPSGSCRVVCAYRSIIRTPPSMLCWRGVNLAAASVSHSVLCPPPRPPPCCQCCARWETALVPAAGEHPTTTARGSRSWFLTAGSVHPGTWRTHPAPTFTHNELLELRGASRLSSLPLTHKARQCGVEGFLHG